MISTAIKLREAANENIRKYCKDNNCSNDYDMIHKNLIIHCDEYNLKLPIDFYKDFYNLTVELLSK